MSRLVRVLLLLTVLGASSLAIAPAVFADEPFPPCDASHDGDIWKDPQSGEEYECVLDPYNGFWYWRPKGPAARVKPNIGYTYKSSTYGCAFNIVSIASDYFGAPSNGAGSGTYSRFFGGSPACKTSAQVQPPGELRGRTLIQEWTGSAWSNCVDSGFIYSNVSASSWLIGVNMFSVPDCGAGSYRAIGYGSFFQGGAWRGTSRTTTSIYMQ